jgi:hypothetical protein
MLRDDLALPVDLCSAALVVITQFIFENSTDTCNPFKIKHGPQPSLTNGHHALASRLQQQWERWLAFHYARWRKERTRP